MKLLLAFLGLFVCVSARGVGRTPDLQYDEILSSVIPEVQTNPLHVIFTQLAQIPFFSVRFYHYSRENREGEQLIVEEDSLESIKNSKYNPNLPLKLVCHGFLSNHESEYMQKMKDEFLEKEDLNVILIDWEAGAAAPFYIPGVVVFIRRVGLQTVAMMHQLRDAFHVSMKDVHVIGHSLGAHISGFVGQNVMIFLNESVSRITGLDPAGVLFELSGLACRLDPQDADFVDVIHTNAGYVFQLAAGLGKMMGDVDFYPNGGKLQPGCGNVLNDILINTACSHSRAWELFTESIKYPSHHGGFKAYKCDGYSEFKAGECFTCENNNCGKMGYDVKGRGTYYLDTRDSPPYRAENLIMTAHMDKSNKKFCGSLKAKMVSPNNGVTWKEEMSIGNAKPDSDVSLVFVEPHNGTVYDVYMKYSPNKLMFWCPNSIEMEWFIVRHDSGPYDYAFSACGSQTLNKKQYEQLIPTDC